MGMIKSYQQTCKNLIAHGHVLLETNKIGNIKIGDILFLKNNEEMKYIIMKFSRDSSNRDCVILWYTTNSEYHYGWLPISYVAQWYEVVSG